MCADTNRKLNLTWGGIEGLAGYVLGELDLFCEQHKITTLKVYPVPRGGVYAAQAVKARASIAKHIVTFNIVENVNEAHVVIDDIIDSGATRDRFSKPFFALIDKTKDAPLKNTFVVFPWERMTDEACGPLDNIRRILQHIGDDPEREGLRETPLRVMKSHQHLFSGYGKDPADVMKVFEDGGEDYDQMVLLKDIEFFSTCEHHMQPFFGRAHIAYIPDKKVLGISKLARLLEVFSRRLQIQERLTTQVADALMEHLEPKGAAVIIEAKHFCMVARGVEKQNSVMTTSALRGAFMTDATARSEFMSMVKG